MADFAWRKDWGTNDHGTVIRKWHFWGDKIKLTLQAHGESENPRDWYWEVDSGFQPWFFKEHVPVRGGAELEDVQEMVLTELHARIAQKERKFRMYLKGSLTHD